MVGTVVVFDVETQNRIDDMPAYDRASKVKLLEVSCLCYLVLPSDDVLAGGARAAQAVEDAKVHTLWRDEDPENVGPFEPMLKAFDEAEVISTYNGFGFDHLVMIKYYRGDFNRYRRHVCKAHDCFANLRNVTEVWFRLDTLLQINDIPTKKANGLVAIQWWHDGERDLLREYCEEDTRALARLLVRSYLKLPKTAFVLPNFVFGLSSAIGGARTSALLDATVDTETAPNVAPRAD